MNRWMDASEVFKTSRIGSESLCSVLHDTHLKPRAGRSMNEQQGVLANTLKRSPIVKSSWRAPLWSSAHPSTHFCSHVELFCPCHASLWSICPVHCGCQDSHSKWVKGKGGWDVAKCPIYSGAKLREVPNSTGAQAHIHADKIGTDGWRKVRAEPNLMRDSWFRRRQISENTVLWNRIIPWCF